MWAIRNGKRYFPQIEHQCICGLTESKYSKASLWLLASRSVGLIKFLNVEFNKFALWKTPNSNQIILLRVGLKVNQWRIILPLVTNFIWYNSTREFYFTPAAGTFKNATYLHRTHLHYSKCCLLESNFELDDRWRLKEKALCPQNVNTVTPYSKMPPKFHNISRSFIQVTVRCDNVLSFIIALKWSRVAFYWLNGHLNSSNDEAQESMYEK